MLTMKTKYALKALSVLAANDSQEPMLIADIAEREDIPKKFLELILRELKQHGILESKKGRGGGYYFDDLLGFNKPAVSRFAARQ